MVSGAWADISGSLKNNNSDSAPAAKLTADVVGWVGSYYDRDIPSAGGAYKYQVTGTKDGKSQTKETGVVNFTAQQTAWNGQIVLGPGQRQYAVLRTERDLLVLRERWKTRQAFPACPWGRGKGKE